MSTATFQTKAPPTLTDFCEEMSALFTEIERQLYRELKSGKNLNDLKREYQVRYGINARQFNAVHTNLKAKIKSREECYKRQLNDLKSRIADLEKAIKKLKKKLKNTYPACSIKRGWKSPRCYIKWLIHQKQRSLAHLKAKHERLQANKPKLIFGSRQLWQAQFNLEANGYTTHEEWLKSWQRERNNEFFVLGSHEEEKGCVNCQLDEEGNIIIKVPYHLENKHGEKVKRKQGKYVKASGIKFPYGQADIDWALSHSLPLHFRFVRKQGQWYIFCTINRPEIPYQSRKSNGMLGVDLNPAVIGWAYVDAEGNLKTKGQITINVQDKSTHQTSAILGEAAKELVNIASLYGCPIVVEKLDFENKKRTMKESGVRYSRMLSNFAYSKFDEMLSSRGERYGIQVIHVNPAYSSVIGLMKFLSMYGLSSDTAAALVLARRGLRLSERIPASLVAFESPEDASKHTWSFWNQLRKKHEGMRRHSFFRARATNSGTQVTLTVEGNTGIVGKSIDACV